MKRQVCLFLALPILILGGCATGPTPSTSPRSEPVTESAATDAPAAADDATASAQKKPAPASPAQSWPRVSAIRQQLRESPRSLYSVANNHYTFYLGGQFTAIVDEQNGQLLLTPDSPDAPSCRYDEDGKADAQTAKNGAFCTSLLDTLEQALATP